MPTDDIAIWFGILVLIVVGIGMTCPPIGLNVFVVASLARDVLATVQEVREAVREGRHKASS